MSLHLDDQVYRPTCATDFIYLERKSQIEKHGFTPEKDYEAYGPNNVDLLLLARYLTMEEGNAEYDDLQDYLFLDQGACKMSMEFFNNLATKSRKEKLTIAAALIAAQIDKEDYENSIE